MTHQDARDPHIEANVLAAFVDGRLGTADAAPVEAHLDECADCRRELIAVGRLLSTRSRRWSWSAGVLLAAAAVLLLMVGRPDGQRDTDGSPIRGGGHPDLPTPATIAPADGATLPGGAMTFVWHGVSGSAVYRLTLTDERGDVVWTTESTDTSVALAPAVRLLGAHGYYWSVDVLLADGRSTTTGFHTFRVTP